MGEKYIPGGPALTEGTLKAAIMARRETHLIAASSYSTKIGAF